MRQLDPFLPLALAAASSLSAPSEENILSGCGQLVCMGKREQGQGCTHAGAEKDPREAKG